MGDNEIILGDVHRSPDIYLTAEENAANPQLGDCVTNYSLKWGPLLPDKVNRIAQHARKGEKRK
jgi:hypothetical protein